MRYGFEGDDEGRTLLSDARLLIERKIAEINRLVLPDVVASLDPEELRRITLERMQTMGPTQQVDLKVKLGLAMAELDKLMDEMTGILSGIGDEMQKLNQYSRASGFYSQAGRAATRAFRRY